MPSWLDFLLGGQQAPVFPQGQQPQQPLPMRPMAVPPQFAMPPEAVAEPTRQVLGGMGSALQGIGQGALNLAAFPGRVMQAGMAGTPYTTEQMVPWAAEMATNMVGAGSPFAQAGALGTSGGKPGIRAYHGSPHDFERFDISRIGTGEGAQAYGHGLYFAESEPVARMYRENLARPSFIETKSGVPISSDLGRILEDAYNDAINVHGVRAPSGNDAVHLAQQNLEKQRAAALKAQDFDWYNKVADQQAELARMGNDAPKYGGKMYEVNIKAQPEQFLDWDKPLNQQPEPVRSAIEAKWGKVMDMGDLGVRRGMSGADFYHFLNRPGYEPPVEHLQQKMGIPGIRYLDQGSRAGGQGTSNYVVFSDQLIDILRKYGLIGMLGGTTAAPMFARQEQQ